MYLDRITLENVRITKVTEPLSRRGFEIPNPYVWSDTGGGFLYFFQAIRKEGSNNLTLWVIVEGEPYAVQSRMQFENTVITTSGQSGAVQVYLHGTLDGDVSRVTEEMSIFQSTLREKFESFRGRK